MRNLKTWICRESLLKFRNSRIADIASWNKTEICFTVDNISEVCYISDHLELFCIESKESFKVIDCDVKLADQKDIDRADEIIHLEYLHDEECVFFALQSGYFGLVYKKTIHSIENPNLSQYSLQKLEKVASNLDTVAFSPDFDKIVASTSTGDLLMLNRDFEVLSLEKLEQDGFGQDAFVAVGWGKKETQFHGSEGKAAALTKNQSFGMVLPYDDKKTRISWREDARFFAVSSYCYKNEKRTIRIWTDEWVHSTTAETCDSMSHVLSWKPSGNLIASTQAKDSKLSVIFFERNGLRHGEFFVPFDAEKFKIREISWNKDSTCLAVWIEQIELSQKNFESYLTIWTTSNYHWYMKKCLNFTTTSPDKDCRLKFFAWDPEIPMKVYLIDNLWQWYVLELGWTIDRISGFQIDDKNSTVVVIDGDHLLITDFAQSVVPPPMANSVVRMPGFVNSVSLHCLENNEQILALLYNHTLAVLERNRKSCYEFVFVKKLDLPGLENRIGCQIVSICPNVFILVNKFQQKFDVLWYKIQESEIVSINPMENLKPEKLQRLAPIFLFMEGNELSKITDYTQIDVIEYAYKNLILSLTTKYQMKVNGKEISNNVNSYIVHDKEFILLTTLDHKLFCLPVADLLMENLDLKNYVENTRNIERGSRIITSVPEKTSVILQMPRGNLETVYPRHLVLNIVKQLLNNRNYKKCAALIKRHRLDPNLIYDHDPKLFLENIGDFIDSVNDSLFLNVFLSELRPENTTKTTYKFSYKIPNNDMIVFDGKIQSICLAMRNYLEKKTFDDLRSFFTTLLTTYVKMVPEDFDGALAIIKKYRDETKDLNLVDEGIRYLTYIMDVNLLIDVALGTYDFDLVMMVFEKSQNDPKEVLPFLNELKQLEPNTKMFRIDCHLKRYAKALGHLYNGGELKLPDFYAFTEKYELYIEALQLTVADRNAYKTCCDLYAKYLQSKKLNFEAAVFFAKAEKFDEALQLAITLLDCTLFESFIQKCKVGKTDQELLEMKTKFANQLKLNKKFEKAGQIFYSIGDRKNCLLCLIEGRHFMEAYLKASESDPNLQCLVKMGIKKYFIETQEILNENRQKFTTHFERLKTVRTNKRQKLENAVIEDNVDFEDDAYSDITSTTASRSSNTKRSTNASIHTRSARTMSRKDEKKRTNLKENSPHEDLALLNALNGIVKQVDSITDESVQILEASLFFEELKEVAGNFNKMLKDALKFIAPKLDIIWPLAYSVEGFPGPLGDFILTSDSLESGDSGNNQVLRKLRSLNLGSDSAIKIDPLLMRPSFKDHYRIPDSYKS